MNLEKTKLILKEHIKVYAETLPKGSGYTGDQPLTYLTEEQSQIALEYGIPIAVRSIYCGYHGSDKDMYGYKTVQNIEHFTNLQNDTFMESRASIHSYLPNEIQKKMLDFLSEATNIEQQINMTTELTEEEICAENRLFQYEDLSVCIKQFFKLNQHFKGEQFDFAEWVRAAHEINMDFYERTRDITEQICCSFNEIEKQFGYDVAKTIYDSQAVVLPNELIEAGKYLAVGGDVEDISQHANEGRFMKNHTIDEMREFVVENQSSPVMSM